MPKCDGGSDNRNKIAVENDLDVFIESAGIFAEDGQGASENAIKALMNMT